MKQKAIIVGTTLALLALALGAVSAQAGVRKVAPVAVKKRTMVFRFHGIDASRVRGVVVHWRARSSHGRHHAGTRRIGARKARRMIARGVARIGLRRVARHHSRLLPGSRAVIRIYRDPKPAVVPGPGGDASRRPYSDASPFNRQLPANPPLDPNSAAIVSRLASWGEPQGLLVGQPEGSGEDYGHPTYYSSPSDPVYTIHCTQWTSSCEIEGMQIHIPAAARPASGSDGHMVVVDQASGWEYDFWQVHTDPLPPGGGEIDVSHGGRLRWGKDPESTGLGGGATAAGFGLQAGLVGAEEWATATEAGAPIEHALFMSVRCTGGAAVYPAQSGSHGLGCAPDEAAGAPSLGAHFYLDMSEAQIEALPVPPWKKPILKAMAKYGLYVGDTFGGTKNSFGLAAESDTQWRALGQAPLYSQLGQRWHAPTWQGTSIFDIDSGVEWGRYLKVVAPCVAEATC